MKVQIKTKVKGDYKTIMHQFDRKLFEALKPRYPKVEIVSFTGSKKGDKVHLRFHSPLKAEWISHITADGEDDQAAFFIDEGVKLPFPLSYWRHKHIVKKARGDHSYIIDEITFTGINFLFSLVLYPAIYLAFLGRKKIYKAYFDKEPV